MELTDYVAILGLVVGGIFLLMAIVTRNRGRGPATVSAPNNHSDARQILSFEDTPLVDGEPTADRMKKLASICASAGRNAFAAQLDFTVDSIQRLDRMIVSGWGVDAPEPDQKIVHSVGAYIGEILVRRTDGHWVSGMTEEEPASVMFLVPGDEPVNISPFMLVREKFQRVYNFDLSIAYTVLEQKLKELKAA